VGTPARRAILALAMCGCGDQGPQQPACAEPSKYLSAPPQQLSRYCLLTNQSGTLVAAAEAVPYDVNTPLFSDYALKARLIRVPAGTSIQYDPTEAFDLPVGSVIAKTFAFPKDYRRPTKDIRVVETRVLLRTPTGWIGKTYAWNDAQTDATLVTDGETVSIGFLDSSGTAQTAGYHVASEMDCHTCHDNAPDGMTHPIGLSARQLNRDFDYSTGAENQIAHLSRLGLLAGAPNPAQAPRLPAWNEPSTGTVAERGRAYLEANCAHCHNRWGLADEARLSLRADETNPIHLGICRPTLADEEKSGGFGYDVVPGDPDHSVMAFRLMSTQDEVMMPLIGRSLVHTEGLSLVRAWIAGLAGSCDSEATVDGGGTADGAAASPDAAPTDAGPLDAGDASVDQRDGA
jgi:uncharacterized repeat protein (TIGR03806 family)